MNNVVLNIRVIPRSSRPGVAGTRDGAILIRLKAAPVEGAANEELIELLAGVLDVPRRNVSIISGERGRLKRVRVVGVTAEDIARKL